MHRLYSAIEDLLEAPEGAGGCSIQFKEAKQHFEFDQAVRICCALSNCGGGLPAGVTFGNIRDRQSPRNRRIAEILALCGLVERSGQGMNLIFEESIKEAKAPPEFTGSDAYFLRITLHGMVLDKEMLSVIGRIGEERMNLLHTDDLLIINGLFHERSLDPDWKLMLLRLTEMGIVEHTGRNKYVLARALYKAAGKPGTHTRLAGLTGRPTRS